VRLTKRERGRVRRLPVESDEVVLRFAQPIASGAASGSCWQVLEGQRMRAGKRENLKPHVWGVVRWSVVPSMDNQNARAENQECPNGAWSNCSGTSEGVRDGSSQNKEQRLSGDGRRGRLETAGSGTANCRSGQHTGDGFLRVAGGFKGKAASTAATTVDPEGEEWEEVEGKRRPGAALLKWAWLFRSPAGWPSGADDSATLVALSPSSFRSCALITLSLLCTQ
jgi:hypothetical protein